MNNSHSGATIGALWEWLSDTGWVCYESKNCSIIENSFQTDQKPVTLVNPPWTYRIDVSAMKQENISTGKKRQLRRDDQKGAVWMWQSDFDQCQRYDISTEKALENLRSLPKGKITRVYPWSVYSVNIDTMKQTNTASGFVRNVFRIFIDPKSPNSQPKTKSTFTKAIMEHGSAICEGSSESVSAARASEFILDIYDYCSCEECLICLDKLENGVAKLTKCGHFFHRQCLMDWVTKGTKPGFECPKCKTIHLDGYGDSPAGSMKWFVSSNEEYELSGLADTPTIVITYDIPSGVQSRRHPNPGAAFSGTSRTAFLPYNKDGQRVLKFFIEAFKKGHTFTVGRSVTTGVSNTAVWNGIHHKTRTRGGITDRQVFTAKCRKCVITGAAHFGYPDETYFSRVVDELKCKGLSVLDVQ